MTQCSGGSSRAESQFRNLSRPTARKERRRSRQSPEASKASKTTRYHTGTQLLRPLLSHIDGRLLVALLAPLLGALCAFRRPLQRQNNPPGDMGGRKYPSIDLFSDPPPLNLTSFQRQYVRDFDWASSPLGPVQSWPLQLRQMVNIVQRDKSSAVVYWDIPSKDGAPDVVIVYNEAYTHIMCA